MSDLPEVFFEVNMTGVAPSGVFTALPDGVYKATVESLEWNDKKDDPGVKVCQFNIRTTEPGYEGATRRLWIRGVDASEKGQNARRQWRTALESCGHGSAALDTGATLQVGPKAFLGKECHVHVVSGDPGDSDSFDDVRFVTPKYYSNEKKNMKARAADPSNVRGPTGQGAQGSRGSSGGSGGSGGSSGGGSTAAPLEPDAIKKSLLE